MIAKGHGTTMGKDLNKVMLTGYLGADPSMRYTEQGSAVTTFRVASGRTWKSSDGTAHDDTEWFRVVAWDKLAEICNQYLSKGTRVYIEGRLQTRKWIDDAGMDRYSTDVVASDMIILSNRRPDGGPIEDDPTDELGREPAPAARRPAPAAAPPARTSAPARAPQTPARAPARNVPQAIDNDEDLPF